MGRRPAHVPLAVYLNDQRVGTLHREPGGAIRFVYHQDWLDREPALPVSLSLPLRETPYRGAPVAAVFENMLPDSDALRRRVAEKVGARGIDAYSLLSVIGRDCVGALQFRTEDDDPVDGNGRIEGEPVDDNAIEMILNTLRQAPLGLSRDDPFRISVAGAQEKTALLRYRDKWLRPHGTTATTHLLKTQIGRLPGGVDLSNSVENEYYCLKLIEAFALPVNQAYIETFGDTRALVIERFDRRWTRNGRLLRLPQEDCCQALSVPPTLKYEADGGPGMVDILEFLTASDTPGEDQDRFFKAQVVFWLIGATDGHAKNFSVFIGPGGTCRLTPLYDVLTAQPSLAARRIERKQMKLAMSVGKSRHYRLERVLGRHFVQTGERAGLSKKRVLGLLDDIVERAPGALDAVEVKLPPDFPADIHDAVREAVLDRLKSLAVTASVSVSV